MMMEENASRSDIEILIAQMKREAEEYNMDSSRMAKALESVNLTPATTGIEARYQKSLEVTATTLNILTPDTVNLTLGISDFEQDLEDANDMLESTHRAINCYRADLPNVLKRKEWWQKRLQEMEANEEHNQAEFSKANKSGLFHSKKKAQYDSDMKRIKNSLDTVGYEKSLSHEALVELGDTLREMDERLKPLRLQLQSYKDLPPNLSQARVKLEEKKMQFNKLERKFSDKLVDIGANASVVS